MAEEINNKDISNDILNKIKCDKICPTPKWCFVCKNYASWLIVFISGLIISLSLSLMAFLFISHDWDIYQLESENIARHILVYTPYLWIILFLLFILLAVYNFNKTEDGYKFGFIRSIFTGLLIVVILSSFMMITGLSSKINDNFRQDMPGYKVLVRDRCDIWDDPEKGLLSGRVQEIKNDEEFILNDFKDNSWQVRKENVKIIPPEFIIKEGGNIKMIGRICDPCPVRTFIVNTIKPW